MSNINPYKILGLGADATDDDVKRAYREKAKAEHPDAGGDRNRFALVKLAKDILSDPKRRQQYDEHGTTDETAPDNTEALAMGLVTQAINQLIDNDIEKESFATNVVAEATKGFSKRLRDTETNLGKLKRMIGRFEKAQTKFRRKSSGPNMLSRLMEQRIAQGRNVIANCERDIVTMKRTLEILKDYDFEADEKPRPTDVLSAYQQFYNTALWDR